MVPVQVGALEAGQRVDGEPGGGRARRPDGGQGLEAAAGSHRPPRHAARARGRCATKECC